MVATRSTSTLPPTPPAAAKPTTTTWSHTPTTLTLLWLAVSLPLVAWDTGYVLLRPLSMPGGSLHWPLWVPYELYGRVDHGYGFKQWNAGNGFTGAQGALNLVETVLYLVYLGLWWAGRKDGNLSAQGVGGRRGALAVTVAFSAAVMTVSKTVLYWLNEYFSGFDNIGHNSPLDLLFLWIIPNGAWLVFPSYMIYSLGSEIVDGLAGAAPAAISSARGTKRE
ncbi:hypothetical protein B0T22DRAFT_301476 [Podospora appendiculata]|uniref:C6 transcription factor n=1 Tax=Podospora appendiculata TaxID=314037 RepID=A0AAE0X035_9PEZI|nr:hypothetical protein B0T22DRAFT_301476 [Podospora appendiculata]